jgi:hypothetical protein
MERWRARLAVAGDQGARAEEEEGGAAGGADEGEDGGAGGDEDAPRASGEFEFVAEGQRKGRGAQRPRYATVGAAAREFGARHAALGQAALAVGTLGIMIRCSVLARPRRLPLQTSHRPVAMWQICL